MISTVTINYLAVAGAAVVSMALGAIWYSPVLFANSWMKLIGKTTADLKKEDAWKGYLVAALMSLLLAYVLAHFVALVGAITFADGAITGAWAWLGFVVPATLANYVFEGRPLKLFWINSLLHLVEFIVLGGILAIWH